LGAWRGGKGRVLGGKGGERNGGGGEGLPSLVWETYIVKGRDMEG